MTYLGIDPGKTGAAWLYTPRTGFCTFLDLPYMGKEPDFCALHSWLLHANHNTPITLAHIEKQWTRPVDSKPNAFTSGQGYGALRMALASLEIPYELITPQKWKADAGLIRADKDKSRALAAQLLPAYAEHFSRVKDHGRAEAALIALRASGVFQRERVSA